MRGTALTVYAVQTSKGVATLGCAAPAGVADEWAPCAAIADSLSVDDAAKVIALRPNPELAQDLEERRASLRAIVSDASMCVAGRRARHRGLRPPLVRDRGEGRHSGSGDRCASALVALSRYHLFAGKLAGGAADAVVLDGARSGAQVRERGDELGVVQPRPLSGGHRGREGPRHRRLGGLVAWGGGEVDPELVEDVQRLQPPAAGVRARGAEFGLVVLADAGLKRLARQPHVEGDLVPKPEGRKTGAELLRGRPAAVEAQLGPDGEK